MSDNVRERANYSEEVRKSPALRALVDYFRSEIAWEDHTLIFGNGCPEGAACGYNQDQVDNNQIDNNLNGGGD